jgi:hypothetical protein
VGIFQDGAVPTTTLPPHRPRHLLHLRRNCLHTGHGFDHGTCSYDETTSVVLQSNPYAPPRLHLGCGLLDSGSAHGIASNRGTGFYGRARSCCAPGKAGGGAALSSAESKNGNPCRYQIQTQIQIVFFCLLLHLRTPPCQGLRAPPCASVLLPLCHGPRS